MATSLTNAATILTAAELLKRVDARVLGDLVADDGVRVTASALLTDENLAALLIDSLGEIEAACLVSKRYLPAELAALEGVALARLYRLQARLVVCLAYERRGWVDKIPETYKQALEDLQALRDGQRIFGTLEHANAGLLQSEVETKDDVDAREGTTFLARRYFGIRGNRMGE